MNINEIKNSFEKSGFEISQQACNERIQYYKYKCRFKLNNNNDYLAVILNNNKIVKDENFLSISINNKFVLRNRKFGSLEDIRQLLILSIIKLKELDPDMEFNMGSLEEAYELVNTNYQIDYMGGTLLS